MPGNPIGTPTTSTDWLEYASLIGLADNSIEKPPKYAGRRENDACQIWLIRVEWYFGAKSTLSKNGYNDTQKIAIASGLLEKQAMDWWNPKYKHLQRTPINERPIANWEEWKSALLNISKDVRTQEQRRDEFDTLRQMSSVQAFRQAIDMCRLYLEPRPTDEDCLLLF